MLACRTCSWNWRRPLVQPIKKVARGDIVGVRITVQARVVDGHRMEWLGAKGEGVRVVVLIGGAHGLLGGDVMEGKEGLWGESSGGGSGRSRGGEGGWHVVVVVGVGI